MSKPSASETIYEFNFNWTQSVRYQIEAGKKWHGKPEAGGFQEKRSSISDPVNREAKDPLNWTDIIVNNQRLNLLG